MQTKEVAASKRFALFDKLRCEKFNAISPKLLIDALRHVSQHALKYLAYLQAPCRRRFVTLVYQGLALQRSIPPDTSIR